MAGVNINITGDDKDLQNAIKRSNKSIDEFTNKVNASGQAINNSTSNAVKNQNTLSGSITNTTKGISSMGMVGSVAVGGALNDAFQKVLGIVKQLITTIGEFVGEGVRMATQAQGVERAFKALGNPDLLKGLREQTKGTINDFELMKAAVKASNFGIPAEQLGALLKFAQQMAAATGQSVDYLVDSIVTGLGRKSIMILDNLQINVSELQKRVASGGDFMSAAIEMVNEKLKEQGDLALTAADKEQIAAAKRENAQLRVGNALLGVKNIFSDLTARLYDTLANMIEKYLPPFMKRIENVVNGFIEWYNSSELLRAVFASLYLKGNMLFEKLKYHIKNVIDGFNAISKIGKAVFNLDFDGAKNELNNFKKAMQDNMVDYVKNVSDAAKKSVQITNKQLSKIDITSPLATNVTPKKKSNTKKELTDDQIKQINSIKAQQDKITQLNEKITQERKRQNEDLENQAAQATIDAMADGARKIAAQRELDNKLEIQALKRQKEDYIRAYIQAEKEKFDAQEDLKAKQNEKYIKKTFDPSTIKVDTSMFDAIIGDVTQAQLNQGFDAIDRSWNEYFLKFGNYQQKRAALIEKYNKEIEAAQTGGEKAMLQKELGNQLDELDNSVKNSATLMGQLFADTSKKSVQEIQAIIDKAELLLEYLQAVKDEQGNAVINGNNVSRNDILGLGISENALSNLENSTEAVESLGNSIKGLKGDLGNRSPFKLFEGQVGDAIDKIKKGGKNNIAQGIGEISGAISQFAPQVKEFGNSLGTIFGDEKMGENIGLVVDGIEGIGTAAQGVGKIMSGDVVGGIMDVVNGAAKALNAFGTLFGPDGTAYYEGIKKQLEEINGIYDKIIEKSKEKITFGGGFASVQAASAALDNYYKKVVNLQKVADASGRAGASWNSHSAEWHSNKNVGTANFNQMSAIVGKTIKSMDDLYYLSGEELYLIMSQMPEAWGQIDARIRENLEGIIDCKDEAKELKDALNEALTGVSQDSFYSDFINNISDMSKSWEDMCDDFEKNLQKSIMAGLVASKYKSRIDALYQSWSDAANSDGNISAEEAERLRKEYQSIVEGMAKDRESLASTYGWDDTSSVSATSKGIAAVSQDSFNEYLGTANATLNKAAEILNVSKDQLSNMISINNGVFDIQSIMRENQKIIQDSLNVQMQIERNTFKTAEILNKIDTLGVKSRD